MKTVNQIYNLHCIVLTQIPRSYVEMKRRLLRIRHRDHAIQDAADNAIAPKPFLTEAELAAEIGKIPGNFIETRREVEKGI